MMNRMVEFIEDANGKLSAGRLVAILSFPPATWVILTEAGAGTLTDTRFLIYTGTYAAAFAAGKMVDALNKRKDAV